MKNIILGLALFFTLTVTSQITTSDVVAYVGAGESTCYFVVDFKDGTVDRSYVWGVRFTPSSTMTGAAMLNAVTVDEPMFEYTTSFGGQFLDTIIYNTHTGIPGDYWSLWASVAGPSPNWTSAGWMASPLVDGKWYGASYGFSNPTSEAPFNPIPAYLSTWYTISDITTWYGEGFNSSVIVIDFGDNSYAFGIKYDGTKTATQLLSLLQTFVPIVYTQNNGQVTSMTLGEETNTTWELYKGSNMSSWLSSESVDTTTFSHNSWLGLSSTGERPMTPIEYSTLSTPKLERVAMSLYPNPTKDYINLSGEFDSMLVFDQTGRVVIQSKESRVRVEHLPSGVYLCKILYGNQFEIKKFIKG